MKRFFAYLAVTLAALVLHQAAVLHFDLNQAQQAIDRAAQSDDPLVTSRELANAESLLWKSWSAVDYRILKGETRALADVPDRPRLMGFKSPTSSIGVPGNRVQLACMEKLCQIQRLRDQDWFQDKRTLYEDRLWAARESAVRCLSEVVPLAQSNGVSCGQTSVAMAVNALTGRELRDFDIDARYGFHLLDALNSECGAAGFEWRDFGDLKNSSWQLIDYKLNQEKLPVIVALNGPEFSPSGLGNIVTLIQTEADRVTYVDPADGKLKTTSKRNVEKAAAHPDGNFIFAPVSCEPAVLPFR